MKFTEEQYHEIIKAWQSENSYIHKTDSVIYCLIDDLNLSVKLIGDEALALANPLTREWAHEQYVEKEKRYVWTSKKSMVCNGVEKYKRLFRKSDGDIAGFLTEKDAVVYEDRLTESEVREWGYNPEMFDKEEVK